MASLFPATSSCDQKVERPIHRLTVALPKERPRMVGVHARARYHIVPAFATEQSRLSSPQSSTTSPRLLRSSLGSALTPTGLGSGASCISGQRAERAHPAPSARLLIARGHDASPTRPGGGDDGAAGAGVSAGGAGQGRDALGVPLPGRRPRLAARSARRLRLRAGSSRGARASARAATARAGPGGVADAVRVRRCLSRPARGRTGDNREAALAAREGGARVRRAAAHPAPPAGDRGVADDDPARAPVRSNAGAPPSARAGG